MNIIEKSFKTIEQIIGDSSHIQDALSLENFEITSVRRIVEDSSQKLVLDLGGIAKMKDYKSRRDTLTVTYRKQLDGLFRVENMSFNGNSTRVIYLPKQ